MSFSPMQNAYKTESVALLVLKSLRTLRQILKQSKKQAVHKIWTACLSNETTLFLFALDKRNRALDEI